MVKNLPANAEDANLIPGLGDTLEKEMATTPVFLPGKSHGQRSFVGYSSWGCKRVRHDLANRQHLFTSKPESQVITALTM